MALFRCKRSGNTVCFDSENDIAGLRQHEGYTEVFTQAAEGINDHPAGIQRKRRAKKAGVQDDIKQFVTNQLVL